MNEASAIKERVFARHQEATTQLRILDDDLHGHQLAIETLTEAIALSSRCLESASELIERIEALVTAGLQDIYSDIYEFRLIVDKDKDGLIKGLRPALVKDGEIFLNMKEDCGDGPYYCTSALLLFSTVLMHPGLCKLMVCDEWLSVMDSHAWKNFGEWLYDVCEKTGLQVIMTTHQASPFGVTYNITQKNKIASATLLKHD